MFYYTESQNSMNYGILVGNVIQTGSREIANKEEQEIGSQIQNSSKCLVSLNKNNLNTIKADDTLLIIDDRNVVISALSVYSVFNSQTFGKCVIGYGNFRFVKKNQRVILIQTEEASYLKFIISSAERYYELNQIDLSINEYQKVLQLDKENPEAHLGLAKIYLVQGNILYSNKEFQEAIDRKIRIIDKEDLYFLYFLGSKIKYYEVNTNNKINDIEDGIKYSESAIKLNKSSFEAYYLAGYFYYQLSLSKRERTDDEIKSVSYLLKSIELNKDNTNSLLIIAKIYKNNDNKDKALSLY